MCGLVGLLGVYSNGLQHNQMESLEKQLVLNSFRGWDSTGITAISKKGEVNTLKTLGDAFNLFRAKNYIDIRKEALAEGRFVMAHGRKATVGEKNIVNAHPFVIRESDKKGKPIKFITLIHNGTLDKHNNDGMNKFDVDSHWMANHIAAEGPEAIKDVHGAIAAMWFDAILKKFYIFRNYQRPLWYARDKDGSIFINSEVAPFHYIRQAHDIDFVGKPEEFAPQVLHTVDMNFMMERDKPWEKKTLAFPAWKARIHKADNKDNYHWPDDDNDMAANVRVRSNLSNGKATQVGLGSLTGPTKTDSPSVGFVPPAIKDYGLNAVEHFYMLQRRILNGQVDYVEWKDNDETCYWKPLTQGQKGQVTTEYRKPPVEGLIEMCKANDTECELTIFIGGILTTEMRSPPPLSQRSGVILKDVSKEELDPIILLSRIDNIQRFSKEQLKSLTEHYALPQPMKPDQGNRWHSKTIIKDKDGKDTPQAVISFGFSETKNPWHFSAYGNEVDGFFYINQKIAMTIEWQSTLGGDPKAAIRYSGSLSCKDSTPIIRVDFWAQEHSHQNGAIVTGRVTFIRAATKQEFDEEGIHIVIALGSHDDISGYGVNELDEIIEAPHKIMTLADALTLFRKRNAA